jgi:O-methyltransferase
MSIALEDCFFYTLMELPGEIIPGSWDLRACADDYLGRLDYRGRSVLEIGPASGFLTFMMEGRGAEVTAIEMGNGFLGHPVPHIGTSELLPSREDLMRRVHNGFWYSHNKMQSRAKVHYGDAGKPPAELGTFDIGLLGAVLLHSRDPLALLQTCAERCRTLVITEAWHPWMDGNSTPVMRLVPDAENQNPHTWWEFTPALLEAAASIWGFTKTRLLTHAALHGGGQPYPLYTLVLER